MKKISVVIPCYYSEKSLAIIVNDAIKEQELRKQREKERERRSTYDRSS